MTMVKKLTKTGTSYSIIIDKSIMKLLSINPDSLLEIKTDGKSLIMTPVDDSKTDEEIRREKFLKVLENSHKKLGGAYKRLAE